MTHAVACENVWKSYRVRRPVGLRGMLLGGVPRDTRFARHWALSGVNFIVTRGQALGVIGPNGSGKTTLLAILLGAVQADRGRASLNGRAASLLELGAGFQGHLTGRENVYLYGSILGMTLAEIRSRFDRIAGFSEMGASLDRPLRRYSAGMIARLRFAVIIHSPADILLIDEVMTPDSSRYWPKDRYSPGRAQASFDKQFVRDYLELIHWNKQPPVPSLPDDVVARTREKYREAYRRLVGRELD